MITRRVVPLLGFGAFVCATLLGQQSPSPSISSAVREFPVILQQNVVAGKTAAGTKIQAKLEVPTLVNGTVLPRNAVFSGEVIESVAKTATAPSRLAMRMDSVQWKNGSASVKVYLTAWYYPQRNVMGQDLRYGPEQPASRTWNGMGQYPDPNSPAYKPFPSSTSDEGSAVPDTPSSATSKRRVLMKDVASTRKDDGVIAISCSHSNLKLDKLTTYVLATGDLLPAPAK